MRESRVQEQLYESSVWGVLCSGATHVRGRRQKAAETLPAAGVWGSDRCVWWKWRFLVVLVLVLVLVLPRGSNGISNKVQLLHVTVDGELNGGALRLCVCVLLRCVVAVCLLSCSSRSYA